MTIEVQSPLYKIHWSNCSEAFVSRTAPSTALFIYHIYQSNAVVKHSKRMKEPIVLKCFNSDQRYKQHKQKVC